LVAAANTDKIAIPETMLLQLADGSFEGLVRATPDRH
jgi:hypothetical protein